MLCMADCYDLVETCLLLVQGLLDKCVQQTDFKSMPSQVLCLAAALTFTQQAEQAIASGSLAQLQVSHSCTASVDDLVSLSGALIFN